MNKLVRVVLLSTVLLGLISLPLLSQSKETGAIQGNVTDENGESLPGATVKLTSPNMLGGEKTIITHSNGQFRFVALLPGTYALEISLDGFDLQKVTSIRISAGNTLTVDFKLKPETLEEVVEVIARAPLIDVKDSQQATTLLEKELLVNIPISRSYRSIVTLAPGVTGNGRLFGGAGGITGTGYNIDGVNTSDPYFAGPWVLMDWNTIDEAKVAGVGANAEYGGFSGGMVNVITKSGGNSVSGGIEFYYRGKSWHSNNADDIDWEWAPEYSDDNAIEPSFFLGGPLKKDKLWYFINLQYATHTSSVVDFPKDTFNWQPRVFGKLSAQLGANDRLQTTLAWEANHRNYDGAESGWPVETTSNYRSDDKFLNANWLHIFSNTTFMETKLGGWHGIEKLTGNGGDAYSRVNDLTGELSGNAPWSYDGYRARFQANTAITHHAENFISGNHDFKFGIEVEIGKVKEEYGYTNGKYYIDYYGPYLAYEWEGYPLDGSFSRASVFAQDSWSISNRLTINPGLRFNTYSMGLDGENVYKTNALAPRIGITFDLLGDNTTAIKAHYGRYFDQMRITDVYPAMEIADFYGYFWDGEDYVLDFVDVLGHASVDPDIKQPGTDQFSLAIERELSRDLSIELAFIHKKFINVLGAVETLGQWEAVSYTEPVTGQTYDLWSLISDRSDIAMLITNPKGGTYETVPFTPEGKYNSFQVNLTKRYSNRWQMNVSYAYALADGNYDLGGGSRDLLGNDFFKSKNLALNSEGYNLSDTTHVFKVQGSVLLPLDVSFGVNFMYRSGYRYNNTFRASRDVINDFSSRYNLRAESRGALRYPDYYRLDFRFEKQFAIGKTRLSGLVDFFNLFNSNIVTSTQNQIWNSNYGKVGNIMDPRRFQMGVRFHF